MLLNDKIFLYYDNTIPSSLIYSINDLINDLKSIFKEVNISNEVKSNIIIKIDPFLTHDEQYRIQITDNKIILSGKDDLGTMWSIYTFLSDFLHVNPFYKFEGTKLNKLDKIEFFKCDITNYPKEKFRGWFINDEDLLSGFASYGKRNIDYEYYQDVIAPWLMERIVETALRNKINLIIPSTLIDITNPYEKNILDICSKRGLYISQHHIEPMGVSKYGFLKFAKKHNLDTTFSYVTNKEAIIKCWDEYCKLWSKYPRVIWQIGLRGIGDKPVWETDKSVGNTSKDRGELISSALNKQYEIIQKNYKNDIFMTSTLWMEGAELAKTGDLKFPLNTIIVFSDIGMSQMYGDDFFNIPRDSKSNYGTYNHIAYWHTGPHLAEGTLPIKLKYCYKLKEKHNSNYYSIINVANIKDLMFTIFIASSLAFDSNYDLDDLFNKYASYYFDNEHKNKLISCIKDYFSCLNPVEEEEYSSFCFKYNFSYHKYEDINFPSCSINDGMFRSFIFVPFKEKLKKVNIYKQNQIKYLQDSLKKVIERFNDLYEKLPLNLKQGFLEHFLYQSEYMLALTDAGEHILKGLAFYNETNYAYFVKEYRIAKEKLSHIFDIRNKYFKGEYQNWFNDDRKIGIKKLIDILEEEITLNTNSN